MIDAGLVYTSHARLACLGARFVLVRRDARGRMWATVKWGRKEGGLTDAHRVYRDPDALAVAEQYDADLRCAGSRRYLTGLLPATVGLAVLDMDEGSRADMDRLASALPAPLAEYASRSRGRHLLYASDMSRVDHGAVGAVRWTWRTPDGRGRVCGDLLVHGHLAFLPRPEDLAIAAEAAEAAVRCPLPWQDTALIGVLSSGREDPVFRPYARPPRPARAEAPPGPQDEWTDRTMSDRQLALALGLPAHYHGGRA